MIETGLAIVHHSGTATHGEITTLPTGAVIVVVDLTTGLETGSGTVLHIQTTVQTGITTVTIATSQVTGQTMSHLIIVQLMLTRASHGK